MRLMLSPVGGRMLASRKRFDVYSVRWLSSMSFRMNGRPGRRSSMSRIVCVATALVPRTMMVPPVADQDEGAGSRRPVGVDAQRDGSAARRVVPRDGRIDDRVRDPALPHLAL